MKSPKWRYITETPACYWVRFYKGTAVPGRPCSDCISKTFNFLEYGSKRKALEAATVWRDKKSKQLNRELEKPIKPKEVNTSRNNTGVIGVSKTDYIRTYKEGRFCHVTGYCTNWVELVNGVRKAKNKLFVYKPYIDGDEERAFKLACKLRKRMVRLHYIKRK